MGMLSISPVCARPRSKLETVCGPSAPMEHSFNGSSCRRIPASTKFRPHFKTESCKCMSPGKRRRKKTRNHSSSVPRSQNMNTSLVDNMLKPNTLNTPQDSTTKIEHNEPLPQLQIALRQASPTVSRLPGAGPADSNPKSDNLTNAAASNNRLVESLAGSKIFREYQQA